MNNTTNTANVVSEHIALVNRQSRLLAENTALRTEIAQIERMRRTNPLGSTR